MISKEIISKAASDINNWLPNYIGLPYKHLGNDRDGIDCFNLICLVYKEVLGVTIPYTTQDSGCDVDVDWYSKPKTANILIDRATSFYGWDSVVEIQPFDVILLSIGSTNAPNHCALYLGNNMILQIMQGHPSWAGKYGKANKHYTVKVGRWNSSLIN